MRNSFKVSEHLSEFNLALPGLIPFNLRPESIVSKITHWHMYERWEIVYKPGPIASIYKSTTRYINAEQNKRTYLDSHDRRRTRAAEANDWGFLRGDSSGCRPNQWRIHEPRVPSHSPPRGVSPAAFFITITDLANLESRRSALELPPPRNIRPTAMSSAFFFKIRAYISGVLFFKYDTKKQLSNALKNIEQKHK